MPGWSDSRNVGVANSVDDFVTSPWIDKRVFVDFETVGVEIAFVSWRLSRISSSEAELMWKSSMHKNIRPTSSGESDCSCDLGVFFRVAGAHGSALDQSNLFNVFFFTRRWHSGLRSIKSSFVFLQVKCPRGNVFESLHNMKIREFVQFLSVWAMHEKEFDRDRAVPRYQKLQTMMRWRIDQMIRTRNLRARNGKIETGIWFKSQKKRMWSWKRQWENVIIGTQSDNVQEEIPEVVVKWGIVDNNHFLFQRRIHKWTEEIFERPRLQVKKSFWKERSEITPQKGSQRNLHTSVRWLSASFSQLEN